MHMRREKRAPRGRVWRVKNLSLKRALSCFVYRINTLKVYSRERNSRKREGYFSDGKLEYITHNEIRYAKCVLFS